MDHRLLGHEQETRFLPLLSVNHASCDSLLRQCHPLTRRQAVLVKNGHHTGVCGNQHAPQQMDAFEHAGQINCSMVRCLLVDKGLPPKMWGNSCPRRFTSVTVYHIQGLTWNSDQAALWQGSRFVAREDHRRKNVCPR